METAEEKRLSLTEFALPAYEEIPDVGLFLEQVVRYTAKYTDTAALAPLTGSMVSNYVKKKIIRNPVKKMYSRDQIAYLLFIAVAKNVIPIEDMQFLFEQQQKHCAIGEAYEFFRVRLQESLRQVFGLTESTQALSSNGMDWQSILDKICVPAAHEICLDRCITQLKAAEAAKQ